jgi:hypothetical protein
MRTAVFVIVAICLAVPTAEAQQTPSGSLTTAQSATPIAGIDYAALASSARASKLIGSKVYNGDTSIGAIEDVLVDLDHATVTALVASG